MWDMLLSYPYGCISNKSVLVTSIETLIETHLNDFSSLSDEGTMFRHGCEIVFSSRLLELIVIASMSLRGCEYL